MRRASPPNTASMRSQIEGARSQVSSILFVQSEDRKAVRLAGATAAAIEREVEQEEQEDGEVGTGSPDDAVSEDTDEPAVAPPPAKRQKPDNLPEELSAKWDEAEAVLDDIERKAVDVAEVQKAAKKKLTKLREKITDNTWEVTAHTRTNAEQQKCTIPLLDWLMAREVYKTHDVETEFEIWSEDELVSLKVDVALFARDSLKDNDIRIECKLKKFTEARGQCAFYHDWDLRYGVDTYVYAYFPEKPTRAVIQGFEIDSTLVLWPGQEEMIRLRG